jgi:hypothetical protein
MGWHCTHVTVCDLKRKDFQCQATAVIGPAGRVFYVSPAAVYVWTTDWSWNDKQRHERSMVYRMPLTALAPAHWRFQAARWTSFRSSRATTDS